MEIGPGQVGPAVAAGVGPVAQRAAPAPEQLATAIRVARRHQHPLLRAAAGRLADEGAQVGQIAGGELRCRHSGQAHGLEHRRAVVPDRLRDVERRGEPVEPRQVGCRAVAGSLQGVAFPAALAPEDPASGRRLARAAQVVDEVEEGGERPDLLRRQLGPGETGVVEAHRHPRHVVPETRAEIQETAAEGAPTQIGSHAMHVSGDAVAEDTVLVLEQQPAGQRVVGQWRRLLRHGHRWHRHESEQAEPGRQPPHRLAPGSSSPSRAPRCRPTKT